MEVVACLFASCPQAHFTPDSSNSCIKKVLAPATIARRLSKGKKEEKNKRLLMTTIVNWYRIGFSGFVGFYIRMHCIGMLQRLWIFYSHRGMKTRGAVKASSVKIINHWRAFLRHWSGPLQHVWLFIWGPKICRLCVFSSWYGTQALCIHFKPLLSSSLQPHRPRSLTKC